MVVTIKEMGKSAVFVKVPSIIYNSVVLVPRGYLHYDASKDVIAISEKSMPMDKEYLPRAKELYLARVNRLKEMHANSKTYTENWG